MNVARLVGSLPWMALAAAVVIGTPVLTRRLGWRIPAPRLSTRIPYVGSYILAWALGDLGLIPPWVEHIAEAAVILAYWFAPKDDGDHRRRKGRLRSALKRTREYLAHGIAAPRPAES